MWLQAREFKWGFGVHKCSDVKCGDVECGDVECGDVECGDVECGDVELTDVIYVKGFFLIEVH